MNGPELTISIKPNGLVRVFIDGEQIGCVSSLDFKAAIAVDGSDVRQLRIAFLEGMSSAGIAQMSPELRGDIRESVDALRQIPFAEVIAKGI